MYLSYIYFEASTNELYHRSHHRGGLRYAASRRLRYRYDQKSLLLLVPAIICTTTATIVVAAAPNNAAAADGMAQKMLKQKNAEKKARKAAADASDDGSSTGKAGSNDTFRGGKTEADKINLGTELNKGQTEVANGLMDKLGI